ncbi:MAG: anti-sigma factor [Terriglobales bacterium]
MDETRSESQAPVRGQMIEINQGEMRQHLEGVVRETVEETLNAPLDAQAALALPGAPGTRVVTVKAVPAKPGGRVFFNARRLLLVGWGLAPLPANQTYEMWLLPRHGPPVPAGLFRAGASGAVQHLRTADWSRAAAVAVSVEPAGVRPQPSGPIVLVAKLPGE